MYKQGNPGAAGTVIVNGVHYQAGGSKILHAGKFKRDRRVFAHKLHLKRTVFLSEESYRSLIKFTKIWRRGGD